MLLFHVTNYDAHHEAVDGVAVCRHVQPNPNTAQTCNPAMLAHAFKGRTAPSMLQLFRLHGWHMLQCPPFTGLELST